jgi:hypothetical protein
MNLGHLFLKWGEGESFSPLVELKKEVTRHSTSSQHLRLCTFDFKIVRCAKKEEACQ